MLVNACRPCVCWSMSDLLTRRYFSSRAQSSSLGDAAHRESLFGMFDWSKHLKPLGMFEM